MTALAPSTQTVSELLATAVRDHHPRLALACSFSQEDVLLLGLALRIEPRIRVFSLDTGRLPEETHRYAQSLMERFSFRIEWVFPEQTSLETLVQADGPYGFRNSLEARHRCCEVRKVEPSSRVLGEVSAWVTGQRRSQSVTRSRLEVVEHHPNGPMKFNPLADWSFGAVESALKLEGWPRHPLYQQGFRSIGCAPCTRAVQGHEDERAGRWWWESAEHKECGLHVASPQPEIKESFR